MGIDTKKYISVVTIAWFFAITISLAWNLFQERNSRQNQYLQTARAFFHQMVITRNWNAGHGGVYVEITDKLSPNPYLDDPQRDVETKNGLKLTKVNPAFMTRLISAITEKEGKVIFHITSLKPINPDNTPAPWESAALKSFEDKGEGEHFELEKSGKSTFFRYIAPLKTEESCLRCHGKYGDREGGIRGGISVIYPVDFRTGRLLVFSHLVIAFAGILIIFGFGRRLTNAMEDLRHQSQIDGLTQIFNRRNFEAFLHREWLRNRRLETHLSLILCDIDYFKLYNDTYGHQAGDDCLKKVAKCLKESLKRPTDLVARYGGEEFVIVLPDTSPAGALRIAETIRSNIHSLKIPHTASEVAPYLTLSSGVATTKGGKLSEAILTGIADQALYRSKSKGRNMVSIGRDLSS